MRLFQNIWHWVDDRTGLGGTVGAVMRHLVPPGSKWFYVFGSATLVAFIVQVVTGIALATAYVPSAESAYPSLQFISHAALFGRLLRGMHYFGASMMVLFVGVHTIRVFLMAAYKFPREMNWLTGAALLALTLAMAFTGQLLRWDQNAIWSVIVAAKQGGLVPGIGPIIAHFILAGDVVGGATLSRFFGFHVFFIPALIFAFLAFHLYLVLKNGISEPPKAGRLVNPATYRDWYHRMLKKEGVPFWPDAAWRDTVFGVGLIGFIMALALIFGPPELTKPPDPTILHADPRPDWYFLWYFAVLALMPHGLEPYVIVLGPLIFGILLCLVPFFRAGGERSPNRRPWAVGVALAAALMIAGFWVRANQSPWSPHFNARPLPAQVVGATTGPVAQGAQLFHAKGCEFCHAVAGRGGQRGPDLTYVGNRLTTDQMTIRILNGGNNMPAFGPNLTPEQLDALVAFLQSRKRP